MADFYISFFESDENDALYMLRELKEKYCLPAELWCMEPDKYGNRYVCIIRKPTPGKTPKLKLIEKIG